MSPQPVPPVSVMRGAAELADAADLRSAVAASLAARPIDELALRRNVWMLVATERTAGASPSHVISTLNDLIDEAALTPVAVRHARLRQVILWCVDAYFGHLGDDVLRREGNAGPSLPRPASNR
jgi:hypothetical protein